MDGTNGVETRSTISEPTLLVCYPSILIGVRWGPLPCWQPVLPKNLPLRMSLNV